MTTTQTTFRYAGDDWKGPAAFNFTYTAPVIGGAPGTPVNLTGYIPSGILFSGPNQTLLTTENGRAALVSAASGSFSLSLERAVTLTLATQTAEAKVLVNRLKVMLTDPTGVLATLSVFPLLVLAPGTIYP